MIVEIFAFSLLFVAVYVAAGIVPSMAISEIMSARKYIFLFLKIAFSVNVYLILLAFFNYVVASIGLAIVLVLFFMNVMEKNYVYLIPVILAVTIISNLYEAMIMALITVFLQGILDYEIERKRLWGNKYIKNSVYFFLLTVVLALILTVI